MKKLRGRESKKNCTVRTKQYNVAYLARSTRNDCKLLRYTKKMQTDDNLSYQTVSLDRERLCDLRNS